MNATVGTQIDKFTEALAGSVKTNLGAVWLRIDQARI
jgi:hypothetical protein